MTNNTALGAIKRRWWIVALFAVIGAAFGAIPQPATVEETATTYVATHTLLLNDTAAAQSGQTIVSANQVTLFATVGEVPARAADAIGYVGNPAELASQVEAAFDFGTGALTLTTTQDTAELAEQIPDAFAQELTGYLAERQDEVYEARVAGALGRLDELEAQINDLTAQLGAAPDDVILLSRRDALARQYSVAFEQAEALDRNPPVLAFTTLQEAQAVEQVDRGLSAPTGRSTRAALGLVLGAALGLAVAVLLGRLDRALRTREQAEEAMDLRARAVIPKVKDVDRDGLVVATGRHDAISDAYRTVRNVVGFVLGGVDTQGRAPVVLVVSPGASDGKTSLAANLAAAFAETGKRTVAVNTDFRRPRLAKALVPGQDVTLPFLPEDVPALQTRALLTKTGRADLVLMDLSSIDASPGELARATAGRIEDLAQVADQVVIDTAPVGASPEVLEFVPHADVIVVTARLGHTNIAAAERTAAILRDVATVPVVLVLTGVKTQKTPYYEYADRRSREEGEPPKGRKARRAAARQANAVVVADGTGSGGSGGATSGDDRTDSGQPVAGT
jgi:Mrp family chromosome partitioning ATPase